ncbi:MAG: hypothetical protein U0270_29445 [Labilithrix sp.]
MRTLLRVFLGLLLLTAPKVALAADDGADWGLPPKPPLPTHPPVVAEEASEGPWCGVNMREGFSDADVSAVEQVICAAIKDKGHPGRYRIHLGKLGAKVIVTLVECIQGTTLERQVVLSDIGEITVAAPRLVEANHDRKAVADTVDVTNVVGEETRVPKRKPSSVHAWLGLLGVGGAGGTGAGANLAISAGSDRWSFVGDFRLAGEAFNKPAVIAGEILTLGGLDTDGESDFSYVSLAGGGRYHLLLSDVSPFFGAGLGVDYIGRDGAKDSTPYAGDAPSRGKAGLAGYGEVGLDLLRTHLVGGAVTLRADLPAFAITETKADPTDSHRYLSRTSYSPIFSAGFAFRF